MTCFTITFFTLLLFQIFLHHNAMVYWIIRSGCENLTFFKLLWMEYSLTRSTYNVWFEDFEKLHYVTLTMNVTLSPNITPCDTRYTCKHFVAMVHLVHVAIFRVVHAYWESNLFTLTHECIFSIILLLLPSMQQHELIF